MFNFVGVSGKQYQPLTHGFGSKLLEYDRGSISGIHLIQSPHMHRTKIQNQVRGRSKRRIPAGRNCTKNLIPGQTARRWRRHDSAGTASSSGDWNIWNRGMSSSGRWAAHNSDIDDHLHQNVDTVSNNLTTYGSGAGTLLVANRRLESAIGIRCSALTCSDDTKGSLYILINYFVRATNCRYICSDDIVCHSIYLQNQYRFYLSFETK